MSRNNMERRFVGAQVSIQSRAEGEEARIISGVAARMNSQTLLWSWGSTKVFEQIAPGAFDEVLQDDCRCLFNHDSNMVLGRTKSNTLRLKVEGDELRFENDVPDTQVGKDVHTLIERGDVTGCSFQFTIKEETRTDLDDGNILYTINKVGRLYDVGPVTFPAYEDTSVSARSFDELKKEIEAREIQVPVKRNLAEASLKLHELNSK